MFRKGNMVKYDRHSKRETQTITKATGNWHVELEKHKGCRIIVLEVNLTLITEYSSGEHALRSWSVEEPPENSYGKTSPVTGSNSVEGTDKQGQLVYMGARLRPIVKPLSLHTSVMYQNWANKRRVWCHRIQAKCREMLISTVNKNNSNSTVLSIRALTICSSVSLWDQRRRSLSQWPSITEEKQTALSPPKQSVHREYLLKGCTTGTLILLGKPVHARFHCNKNQTWTTMFKTLDRKWKARVGAKATQFQYRHINYTAATLHTFLM